MDQNDLTNSHETSLDIVELTLDVDGSELPITPKGTLHEFDPGVYVQEYTITGFEKIADAAHIAIRGGHYTPIQHVEEEGSITIETAIAGAGIFIRMGVNSEKPEIFIFDVDSRYYSMPISHKVRRGDIMCWIAHNPNKSLQCSEICIPLYNGKRFLKLTDDNLDSANTVDHEDLTRRFGIMQNLLQQIIKNRGIEI